MSESSVDIEAKLDELKTSLRQISSTLNSIATLCHPDRRLFNRKYSWELGSVQRWLQYFRQPDFLEKYLRLIDGLDYESVDHVNAMIKRMKNFPKPNADIFCEEEQENLVKLKYEYDARIINPAKDVWAYNHYLLPRRHFEACVFFYKCGIPHIKHLDRLQGKAVIDAGAFIGDSALVLSDYIKGIIFAFEPIPNTFAVLEKTIVLNKATHIIPIQKALWSSETTLRMQESGSASYVTNASDIEVPATTLDKFVAENNVDVGLIKTDLEGAELEFLKGAQNTIHTQHPTILLSIYHKPEDFFELKPLLQEWVPEYKFKIRPPAIGSLFLETRLIAEVDPT